MILDIFTDGACKKNPGPGGWGVAIYLQVEEDKELKVRTYSGGESHTTNNRMELYAVLMALEYVRNNLDNPLMTPQGNKFITIYSDSSYVINGINSWLANWKLKNWVGSNKQPVKNQDLWQEIDSLLTSELKAIINFKWVKGHSGIEGNEMADKLATEAIPK